MSVLADVLTAYRSALTTAGFTNVDETRDASGATATTHKKYRLTLLGDEPLFVGAIHGGAVVDYDWPVTLELSHDPENRESSVWGTQADDMLTAAGVMLKASTRPSGCLLVKDKGVRIERVTNRRINVVMEFTVRVRETQNLS